MPLTAAAETAAAAAWSRAQRESRRTVRPRAWRPDRPTAPRGAAEKSLTPSGTNGRDFVFVSSARVAFALISPKVSPSHVQAWPWRYIRLK